MERLNRSGFHRQQGFSLIQMLITGAVIIIVSSFAFFAIDTARASMRLSGNTRELAGYLEKARSNAIRRNGTATVNIVDANNYSVIMDFDGDGTSETRTITLASDVFFAPGSIGISTTFDWRGRIPNQVGIGLQNTHGGNNSINISGSGDVTLGDEIFRDSTIGGVTLNSNPSDVVAVPTPTPLPSPGASPSSSPTPSPSPDPSASPTPSPSPDPSASPTPSPSPSATASPSPSPSPSPSASPSPSPSPVSCSISASDSVTLPKNGSPRTISVSVTNAASATLTATKAGDVTTVSPASTIVSGNGTVPYTITYPNGNIISGSITVSSPCGNKTINITFN